MNARPVLAVYREIIEGDLLKLVARSNKSEKDGGGARDLRFPWKTFRPTMHRIFTENGVERGKQFRWAEVTYLDRNNVLQTTTLEYWPATPSRPTEDRIAKVSASPALGGKPVLTDQGRAFMVLTKFDNGIVRCDYAYETALRAGKWATEFSSQILNCMTAASARNGHRTVQGYYDFISGKGFCHAD